MSSRVLLNVGDSIDVLKRFPNNSIDSVVADPPYELVSSKLNGKSRSPNESDQRDHQSPSSRVGRGFMGHAWDGTGIAFDVEFWRDIYRVMRPGAHLLAFG